MLGGDHSLAAGSVAATADFLRRDEKAVGVIWVDAHGDMNTPATSWSGNVHGMPLAALLGPEPAELVAHRRLLAEGHADRTVLIGIRNLDEREKERISESGVHVFTMKDIDRAGIALVIEQAIAIAGSGHRRHPRLVRSRRLRSDDRARVGTPVKGGSTTARRTWSWRWWPTPASCARSTSSR